MSENIKIKEVKKEKLSKALEVIHKSFKTVADEFGLTKENCPKHTSFLSLSYLETQLKWGWNMYGLYTGEDIVGYMSLSKENDDTYELHNLAVLPEYRHKGLGKKMLDFAKEQVTALGGTTVKIGIIEESTILKNWYISNDFKPISTKKFEHLPFTSGYLEWKGNTMEKTKTLVIILGPHAVGKMTVGQELAKITDLRLFHNHMSIELTRKLFSHSEEEWKIFNNAIRQKVFELFANGDFPGTA